jgi:hypothetical protein
MGDLETFTRANTRRASVLEVGGFRPTGAPDASHFGLTPLAKAGEGYPVNALGQPLEFICQLNLTQAPFVPEILSDIALITVFVDAPRRFNPEDDRSSWCVRAHESPEGLVALEPPPSLATPRWLHGKGFEARWSEVADHPVYDDPDLKIVSGFDRSGVHLNNQRRSKIGGYPSNIQHEVTWAAYRMNDDGVLENPLHGKVGFAFQIDSESKVGLNWVDGGTVYVGRGVSDDTRGQWFVSWQFY